MSIKIEIIGRAVVATDTVTTETIFDAPRNKVYYDSAELSYGRIVFVNTINLYFSKFNNYNIPLTDAVDFLNVPFTEETFKTFARENLGFNTASGGSEAKYNTTNYNDLIALDTTRLNNGDLSYVRESQGTQWLPYSLGGTYYPNGWYVWNGSEWVTDRLDIATEFNDLNDLKANKTDVYTKAQSDVRYVEIITTPIAAPPASFTLDVDDIDLLTIGQGIHFSDENGTGKYKLSVLNGHLKLQKLN